MERDEASPKVTVPGPENWDHVVMRVPGGLGSPSSLAVPDRVAEFGRITVWSGPAFTVGGWFCDAGFTVTVRSSLLCRAESSAVSRST